VTTFERSEDWELIKKIVTHRRVYPAVSDDFSPPADKWEPVKHAEAWYVIARDGEETLGLWALFPDNRICWKVHTCLLPKAYGERAKIAVREAIAWVWANTPCLRVVTDVPEYNRLALKFALDAGLTQFGLNPKAYMKDGKLHDVIMLGISKPGVELCH
jgi:RimJ/RimL family protein N-acetyltransferase